MRAMRTNRSSTEWSTCEGATLAGMAATMPTVAFARSETSSAVANGSAQIETNVVSCATNAQSSRVQLWLSTTGNYTGNVNGTRQFDIGAGATGHYHLLRGQDSGGSFDAYVDSVSMTAIFTPSR